MRESVQAEVMMSYVVSEELTFRIPVDLRYHSGDPYALRLTFHLPGDAPVTWAFGRELLVDGISVPSGDGDVHIAPCEAGPLSDVTFRLQVGPERALFRSRAAPLLAFLDRTDRLVPLGEEHTLVDLDDSLDETLGRILTERAN